MCQAYLYSLKMVMLFSYAFQIFDFFFCICNSFELALDLGDMLYLDLLDVLVSFVFFLLLIFVSLWLYGCFDKAYTTYFLR